MKILAHNLPKKILVALLIISVVFPFFSINTTQAAALDNMSDTMSRLQTSTLSSHDILFTLNGSNDIEDGDTIEIDFGEDNARFTVANASWADLDFDFNDGTERTIFDVVQGNSPQTPDCSGSSGADDIAVAVNVDTGIIIFEACSSYAADGSTVNIEIGTSATTGGAGTNRITNPGSDGSTPIIITETSDSGTLAVPIMTSDQVTVSATVDPSITSELSSTTCSLGTLSVSAINVCSYTNTVNTNASGGFISTIVDDGNLRTGGGDDINDADGDVDEGTEEYGVSSSDNTGSHDIVDTSGACDGTDPEAATAITTSAQSYANATGPISNQITTLCHSASVAGTTPAGSYQHIVTHITTGTF